jgi:hypothetical protein
VAAQRPPARAKSRVKKQPGGGGEHTGEKGRGGEGRKNLRVIVSHWKKLWEKRAGCGRMRSRNNCFGHVPTAVQQGRQRYDVAAAGEEQHGRCTAA